MTAREYLSRPFLLQQEIDRKAQRITFLRRQSTRLSAAPKQDRVQSTPDPARMQAFLAEAADEEREILRLEEERKQALVDSALVISLLPGQTQVAVMELRYLERRDWDEIARQLSLCESSVYRQHRSALIFLDALPEIRDAGNEAE